MFLSPCNPCTSMLQIESLELDGSAEDKLIRRTGQFKHHWKKCMFSLWQNSAQILAERFFRL